MVFDSTRWLSITRESCWFLPVAVYSTLSLLIPRDIQTTGWMSVQRDDVRFHGMAHSLLITSDGVRFNAMVVNYTRWLLILRDGCRFNAMVVDWTRWLLILRDCSASGGRLTSVSNAGGGNVANVAAAPNSALSSQFRAPVCDWSPDY